MVAILLGRGMPCASGGSVQGVAGTCKGKVFLGYHHGQAQYVREELTNKYLMSSCVSGKVDIDGIAISISVRVGHFIVPHDGLLGADLPLFVIAPNGICEIR
jgi:hypothetical protein